METKLYLFRQNNSGGSFVFNENLDANVYIEAHDSYEADEIATKLGIYFNGCVNGIDCHCCGDRWNSASDYDFISNIDEFINDLISRMRLGNSFNIYSEKVAIVHLLNGNRYTISYNGSINSKIRDDQPHYIVAQIRKLLEVK